MERLLESIALAAVIVVVAVGAPVPARAAACCVASTTDQVGVLGPKEKWLLGAGYSLEGKLGEWDLTGRLVPVGESPRTLHVFSGTAALRVDRVMQIGASLPFAIQAVRFGDQVTVGAGLGDVRTWVRLEPWETGYGKGPPIPAFGFGLSLPTGIPPEQSPDAFGAGATGTGYLALRPSIEVARSFEKGVFRAAVDAVLPLTRPWVTGVSVPGVGWGVSLSGGIFTTSRSTLALSGGVQGRTAGLRDGDRSGKASVEPWASVGLNLAPWAANRISLGLRSSLFVPRIGRATQGSVTLGVTVVHASWDPPGRRSRGTLAP